MATNFEPPADAALREQELPALRQALLAFLRKHTPSTACAEDVLQDVLVKALEVARTGTPPKNLQAWLYTVARNAAIDLHRRTRPTIELDEEMPAEFEEIQDAHLELAHCLRPMADRLPEIYRQAVIALELEGQALKALAAAEGVTVSAIKSRASRGRGMLREELVQCCRVRVSPGGEIIDYDQAAVSACSRST